MGELEKRFFENLRRGRFKGLIKENHPQAHLFLKILKKAIVKGNFVSRGRSTKWDFRLDSIYNK